MKSFLKELTVHILVVCVACQSIYAQAPQWWNDADLVSSNLPVDDFAPLNTGQLKFMAWKAAQQMNSRLPGGAGGALNQMVESWLAQENISSADDFSAATLGQLKAVAAPIYQRLSDTGLVVATPWTETADDDDDHAVANIGQAKRVFSFELPDTLGAASPSGDGESDPVQQTVTTAAAPPPAMTAPALTLDTSIQSPGVYYYGNEAVGDAQAIGYSALPQDATHRYYAGARAKHEFKIPSWTHNKTLVHETRNTKGSKLGSYYKINTTSVENGTHVENYNVDWSGTCTNPIVTTTEATQANGLFSPQFFNQRGTWREKLICNVKQVHTSRHEFKGVADSLPWTTPLNPIHPDGIAYSRGKGDELRTYVTTTENKINHEASGVDDNAINGVTWVAGMNFNWPTSDKIQAKRTEDLTYRYNWQWKMLDSRGFPYYHPQIPIKSPGYPKDAKKNLVNLSGQTAYPVKADKGYTQPTQAMPRTHCTYLKLSSSTLTEQKTDTQTKQTYDVVQGTARTKVPGALHEITLNRDNPVLPSSVKQEFMPYLAGKAWQGWVRDGANDAPHLSSYIMLDAAPNNAGYYAHSGSKLAWALAYQVPTSYTPAQREALRPANTTVTYHHYSPTGSFINSASTSYLLNPGDTLTPALVNASQYLAEGGTIVVTTQTSYLSIDLDVAKILHNTASGELDDSKEESTGAFVSLNSDDDDYSASTTSLGSDIDQTGPITGENDLLPLYLKKLPQLTGAKFMLAIPSKIKVWKNSNRQDEVTSTTELDASVDTTVYAEGVSKGSDLLKLTLRHGEKDIEDAARLKITVFELKGVLNVPGYAAYSYTADGLLPTDSKWGATGGSLKSGSSATQATILWDQGPVVGKAVYEVNSDYIWDLEVNVVQVKIKQTGNTATYNSAPFQKGGLLSGLIGSNSWTNAMTASVVVDTVEGPTINGAQRGKKFMELGIVHQAGFDAKHGLYDDSFFLFPNIRKRSSLQDGQTHWDALEATTLPWTLKDANHHLDITSDSASVTNQVFKTYDQPEILGTYPFSLSGDQVDRLAINIEVDPEIRASGGEF